MRKQYKKMATYFSFLFIVSALGAYYWLKLPYSFSYQRQLATNFISNINNEEYEQAFNLTQRNMYTGKTLEEFKAKAIREIPASGYQFAYSFPKQTNGKFFILQVMLDNNASSLFLFSPFYCHFLGFLVLCTASYLEINNTYLRKS